MSGRNLFLREARARNFRRNRSLAIRFLSRGAGSRECMEESGARFTKYLMTILRLSYDNAEVTIDLRRTSNLPNILRRTQCFFLGTIQLQYRKIVGDTVRILAYDIPTRNLSTLQVTVVRRSYDKLRIILHKSIFDFGAMYIVCLFMFCHSFFFIFSFLISSLTYLFP